MQSQPPSRPSGRRPGVGSLLVAVVVIALLAYFFWPRPAPAPTVPAATPATAAATARPASPGAPVDASGIRNEGGILVDAEGHRILNEAGLPPGPPLPEAKPIPIKAAPGDVIGYRKDANGVSQPLRAGDLKGAANAPGTFAVVDMWADGGPVVVPATEGHHLSAAEVAKLRAAEAARNRAAQAGH